MANWWHDKSNLTERDRHAVEMLQAVAEEICQHRISVSGVERFDVAWPAGMLVLNYTGGEYPDPARRGLNLWQADHEAAKAAELAATPSKCETCGFFAKRCGLKDCPGWEDGALGSPGIIASLIADLSGSGDISDKADSEDMSESGESDD